MAPNPFPSQTHPLPFPSSPLPYLQTRFVTISPPRVTGNDEAFALRADQGVIGMLAPDHPLLIAIHTASVAGKTICAGVNRNKLYMWFVTATGPNQIMVRLCSGLTRCSPVPSQHDQSHTHLRQSFSSLLSGERILQGLSGRCRTRTLPATTRARTTEGATVSS